MPSGSACYAETVFHNRINSLFAYVGLTRRFASLECSAELVKVDLTSGCVVARAWLPPPHFDLTLEDRPTGGGRQRGVRGVVAVAEHVHVATFDAIHILNTDLQLCGHVRSRYFCDLHEFAVTGSGGYVVTCARMDALVWCDSSGRIQRVWGALEDKHLLECFPELLHTALRHDTDWRSRYPEKNPTHLNAVSLHCGDTLVALHNQAVLWSVEGCRIWHDARSHTSGKTHNHVVLDDGTVCLNDTLHGRFIWWRDGKACELDLSRYGIAAERPQAISAPWAVAHGWLRGLARYGVNDFLVGQCPASLIQINLGTVGVRRVYQLDHDWRVSVHGIAVIEH